MEKKLLIIGNWKLNKNIKETKKFLTEFNALYKENFAKISKKTSFGIASNFISLETLHQNLPINTYIVAQNISEYLEGSYTGEVSATMVKEVGVNMVIIGHSERRQFFCENDTTINKKILVALKNNLSPILCVGETLKEYETGKRFEVVQKQLKLALKGVVDLTKVIIAYEPIWAIGTGKTATPEDAEKMCKFIRDHTNNELIIQYGGSVNINNIVSLMKMPNINGALVGNASLEPSSMVKLITLNK